MRKDEFKNIEYITIHKNNKQLLFLSGDEFEGKTKTDLELYLGNKLDPGIYYMNVKQNDGISKRGRIRAINSTSGKEDQTLNKIEQILQANKTGGKYSEEDLNKILEMQEKVHKAKTDLLKIQLESLQDQINNLQKQKIIQDDGLDIQQIITLIPTIMNLKNGVNTLSGLNNTDKNINVNEVPKPILDVLNFVDWDKIPSINIPTLANELNQIIKFKNLPRKDFKNINGEKHE